MTELGILYLASRREPYRRGGLTLSRQVQSFPAEQDGVQLISDAMALALLDDPVVIFKVADADGVLTDVPEAARREAAERLRERIGTEMANEIPSEKAVGDGQPSNTAPASAADAGGISAGGDSGGGDPPMLKEEPKVDPVPAPVAAQPAGRKARG